MEGETQYEYEINQLAKEDACYISPKDLNLLRVCDSTDEVIETVNKWYQKHELAGKQAITR